MNSISNFVEYLKTCSDEDFSASLDDKFTRYIEDDILCLVTEYPEEIIKFLYLFKIYIRQSKEHMYIRQMELKLYSLKRKCVGS